MNYMPLIEYIAALWLLCLAALIWDAKSKKPAAGCTRQQATRCTKTQTAK